MKARKFKKARQKAYTFQPAIESSMNDVNRMRADS